MPTAHANGIDIVYEVYGDPNNEAMVLINGAGGQLVSWETDFVQAFVDEGYFVVTFDNRDSGLSTQTTGPTSWAPALEGGNVDAPYTMHDMAADLAGLLDALDIGAAHLFGTSLGGHIAQVFALDYPSRTLSLCSVMSSTNSPNLPPSPEAVAFLQRPPVTEREDIIRRQVEAIEVFGGKGPQEWDRVGSSRVDLQACKLEYSIVSPK